MVFVPAGEKYKARRGAEQCDPLASMQCGCVIADIVASAMADMKTQKPLGEDLACFGFWYADDGQYVCRPSDVDLFLLCLDRAATPSQLVEDGIIEWLAFPAENLYAAPGVMRISAPLAREALRLAGHKLPIRTKFVAREDV